MQGGSWHAKRLEQLGAGTVAPPRAVPGWQVDVLQSHLRREDGPAPVLAAAGTAPVTARCPASPAGSAPQLVSWHCRGPCLHAGKGCSADLHREKAQRLAELHLPTLAKAGTQSPTTTQESPFWGYEDAREKPGLLHAETGAAATNSLRDPLPRLFRCPAPYRGAGVDAVVPLALAFSMGRRPASLPRSQR